MGKDITKPSFFGSHSWLAILVCFHVSLSLSINSPFQTVKRPFYTLISSTNSTIFVFCPIDVVVSLSISFSAVSLRCLSIFFRPFLFPSPHSRGGGGSDFFGVFAARRRRTAPRVFS